MRPITVAEIQSLQDYELAREGFRRDIIELKKRRRVSLGPLMTLVFENRETVRFQIQEMLRIERIVVPQRVQEEIEVYSDLLPGADELAATLFIEVTEAEKVQETLDRFIGLDEPGRLTLEAGEYRSSARFAGGQSREDRISAVHYVRFLLGPAGRRALLEGSPVVLSVAHAGYQAQAKLGPETVAELAQDLRSE